MIQSNELRTGNYVLAAGQLRQITMIQARGVGMRPSGEKGSVLEYTLERIVPVPLTGELMRRCGFAYHEYFRFWQLIAGEGCSRSEMDVDLDYNVLDFMRRPLVKKVAALHQLQNVYYFLQGRELEFAEG